jgi:hypothetical protein
LKSREERRRCLSPLTLIQWTVFNTNIPAATISVLSGALYPDLGTEHTAGLTLVSSCLHKTSQEIAATGYFPLQTQEKKKA